MREKTKEGEETGVKSKEKFTKNGTKELVMTSLMIAVSMILSYVESLLPTFVPIAGVKIGLANIPTVIALVLVGAPSAACISIIRVFLSALLFGNVSTLIYSLLGAIFSLFAMSLIKRMGRFSSIGISVVGGVFHNLGQILAAMLLMKSSAIFYYFPLLVIFGVLSGTLIGIASGLLAKRLERTKIIKK